MDKGRAKYIISKTESIRHYKEMYIAFIKATDNFREATEILQRKYGVSEHELVLIQRVAMKEALNSGK